MTVDARTAAARSAFGEAAHWFADLVRAVPLTAYDGPGLGVWDLRSLIGHTSRALITVETYLGRPAARVVVETTAAYFALATSSAADRAAVAERGRLAGVALGDDPAQTVDDLVARVLERLGDDDPVIETIAGGMRLSDYLPTRTFELVVHGTDIAAAVPEATLPAAPESALAAALGLAVEVAALSGRGEALLRAVTGRTTLPEGFSVVL